MKTWSSGQERDRGSHSEAAWDRSLLDLGLGPGFSPSLKGPCGKEQDWGSPFPLVLVCSDCHNKISQTGWFKQQTLILSQFWSLEV